MKLMVSPSLHPLSHFGLSLFVTLSVSPAALSATPQTMALVLSRGHKSERRDPDPILCRGEVKRGDQREEFVERSDGDL
jgi:hypothetical protein